MTLVPSKAQAKELAADAGKLFRLVQRVLRLAETQEKHAKQIEKQSAEIEALTNKIIVLEAREEILRAQAREAAAFAAAQIVADLARRIGYLEKSRHSYDQLARNGLLPDLFTMGHRDKPPLS